MQDKIKKYLISTNAGGLGNRLKCLISILRISKNLNKKPLLYWPGNLGCKFSELFKNKIPEIRKEELNKINKKNFLILLN